MVYFVPALNLFKRLKTNRSVIPSSQMEKSPPTVMQQVISIVMGVLMILAAGNHFINPNFYRPIIPYFLDISLVNYGGGAVELLIGIGLLLPAFRSWAALGFMILMILFLPLHLWDLFREHPAMGSTFGAIVRLVLQFGLIYLGYWLWKN